MNYPPSTASLIEMIHKVDRLNSWVRSDSFRHSFAGRLDYVIYHLKGEAIKAAQIAGIASHRLIGVDLKCRDCGGSGRYIDFYGENFPHCRKCSSTGKVHLQFIETTLFGDLVWHSPATYRIDFLQSWTSMEEHPAGDWKPHMKGRDLSIDEAATLLNDVECYFPARPHNRSVYEDGEYFGEVDDFAKYELNLGSTEPDRCNLCADATDDSGFHGVSLGRLEWSANVCKTCKALHGMDVFKRCAQDVPGSLWSPAIAAWVERHP